MSPQELFAILRRHAVAVAAVFIVAAGLGYSFRHAKPIYVDTATVAFTAPVGLGGLFDNSQSLLVIDELTVNSVRSQHGQQQVRNSGGTTEYDVALVNLHNQDFPNYGVPYVTVTTTSHDPAAAQTTFSAVLHVLQNDLAALQAREGARPATRIGLRIIAAPTGPVAQTGSSKRNLAALAVLAIIAAVMIATFLDRHPVRLRNRFSRRARPAGAARDWPTMQVGPGR